jgi:hypothetical protein
VPCLAQTARSHFYGWYAEDFDTVDLQEAKALLDDLCDNGKTLSSSYGSKV